MGAPRKGEEKLTEEIVAAAAEYLGRGWYKHVVKTAMRKQFKHLRECSANTWERILREGRARLREERGETVKETKACALDFYRTIVADEHAKLSDRLRAQERIDQICGHDAKFGDSADPEESAEAVIEFLKELDGGVDERDTA